MQRYLKEILLNSFSRIGIGISKAPSEESLLELATMYWPRQISRYPLIRIGAVNDGGYLLPDCLDGISECYSPGVDEVAEFEFDLAERGIECHLIDYSVESPPERALYSSFTKKFIGPVTSGNYITLTDWMESVGRSGSGDALLQMDIEGAEYSSILQTSEDTLRRFKIIVLELHGLEFLSNNWFFKLFLDFSKKLTKNHTVVHLHPNNCAAPVYIRKFSVNPVLEVSLLRNDLLIDGNLEYVSTFPAELDAPNLIDKENVDLSKNWYCS